jgi:hypothetical protein
VGLKWSGCEVNHSLPYSAEVMNAWSCTSHPPYTLIHAQGELSEEENISITF